MRLREAIIVTVDFDGDIGFEGSGSDVVFCCEDMAKEVRSYILSALQALSKHWLKSHSEELLVDIESSMSSYPVSSVLGSNELVKEFIYQGGGSWGNWSINVNFVGDTDRYFS